MLAVTITSLLVILGGTRAQYYKQTVPVPERLYLPGTTPNYATTTEKDAAAENFNKRKTTPRPIQEPKEEEEEHWGGEPFNFSYAVKESDGNDHSHKADSNGDVVRGEYRVRLPDGRTQVVTYTADWKNGYQAQVSYI